MSLSDVKWFYKVDYDDQQLPTISTQRLRLESIRPEKHFKDLKNIFQDRETMRAYDGVVQSNEQLAQSVNNWFQDWKAGPFGGFTIYTKENQFVGYCGLTKSRAGGVAEISYAVVSTQRKNAYATEAAKALVTYAKDLVEKKVYVGNIPFRRIEATVRKENFYSAKVAKNISMKGPFYNEQTNQAEFFLDLSNS